MDSRVFPQRPIVFPQRRRDAEKRFKIFCFLFSSAPLRLCGRLSARLKG